jgi:hypothetical protein
MISHPEASIVLLLMRWCGSLELYLQMVEEARNSEDPLGWHRDLYCTRTRLIHRVSLGEIATPGAVFFF